VTSWSLTERATALGELAERGTELLIVGGGITGAGILRDAALRGLACALCERGDFASGTSSHTSKMIHGGLRYIAEGALGVTRESCVERDLLAQLNPLLVRPLPFLFCSFDDGIPPWKMLAGLSLYAALDGFQGGGFRLLSRAQVSALSRDLRSAGLRAAGFYHDQQVDDARLVLETLKDARRVGAEAINYAEVIGLEPLADGRTRVRVRDGLNGRESIVLAARVVNATGPAVDRVRALEAPLASRELRPAKGVHVVIERTRVHAEAAISFQARDGRHLFLCPYDDVHLIGTTDAFTDDIDEPRVTRAEAQYVLAAANQAFPGAQLTEKDIVSVYAGVRPLVAAEQTATPPSSVSREHRISEDASGLLSIAGGKLTTYRRMAEQIVDRLVRSLPEARRRALKACTTKQRPLRDDDFDAAALGAELRARFGLSEQRAQRLLASFGADALSMLERAPAEEQRPLGGSRFLLCEVAWSLRNECAANLCDVLERRVRVAVFAKGQGMSELDRAADSAGRALSWSTSRIEQEKQRYRERIATRYRVSAS
jgi:glycerol-3-phosphate dehydrogenase